MAKPTPTDVLSKLPPLPAPQKTASKEHFLAKKAQRWVVRLHGWRVWAEGRKVSFTAEKKQAPVLSKTYPSLHAVAVIRGRLLGKKGGSYLTSLVHAIVDQPKTIPAEPEKPVEEAPAATEPVEQTIKSE